MVIHQGPFRQGQVPPPSAEAPAGGRRSSYATRPTSTAATHGLSYVAVIGPGNGGADADIATAQQAGRPLAEAAQRGRRNRAGLLARPGPAATGDRISSCGRIRGGCRTPMAART